jgi:hypothetical protein
MNEKLVKDEVVLAYKGPFLISMLSNIGSYIKLLGVNEHTQNKLYKIFFELCQNVSRYSADRENVEGSINIGIGIVELVKDEEAFKLSTTNKVLHEQAVTLTNYCNNINEANHDGLRKLKSNKRGSEINLDNNAHLGMIQTGILSANKVEYQIDHIDKMYSYFTITATINFNY